MQQDTRSTQVPAVRRKVARRWALVASTAGIALLAACSSDSISAPVVPDRSNSAFTDAITTFKAMLDSVSGLSRTSPAPAITRSKTFTKAGGTLAIPELGFVLIVPQDAIPKKDLTITVTSLGGSVVAYDFAPHGTVFKKPLQFTQTLAGTNWLLVLLAGKSLTGAYFKNSAQVNTRTGKAVIDETLSATISNGLIYFGLPHFSGYMVSTGRSSESLDDM